MKSIKEQTKTRVYIGVLLLIAVLLLLISNPSWHFWSNWDLFPERIVINSDRKIFYADELHFDFRMIVGGQRLTAEDAVPTSLGIEVRFLMRSLDDFPHSKVVFVYSEKEALAFPDDVIVAWPTTRTLQAVNALNWAIYHSDSRRIRNKFPITLTDVVDDWERIYRLWMPLDSGTHASFREAYRLGHGNDPEFLAKLEDAICILQPDEYTALL